MGWTPVVARRASIFDIEEAFRGKRQFLRATVVGFPGDEEDEAPAGSAPPMKDGDLDREAVAARVAEMFGIGRKKG